MAKPTTTKPATTQPTPKPNPLYPSTKQGEKSGTGRGNIPKSKK